MRSVLLTGARGFIGRYCVRELLALGYEVHAVTNRRPVPEDTADVHWHRADLLSDGDILRVVNSAGAQTLLHLAWIADHPAFWHSEMNLEWLRAGIRLITTFANAGGDRVVVNGSCAEYALSQSGPCIEDLTPIRPATLYGQSKAALHMVLRGYADRFGISLGWGRTFFVYGPHEPMGKAVSALIGDRRSGRTPTIRDPYRLLDYVYVADVARALALLVQSDFDGAVNVGSGEPITLLDVWRCMAELFPSPAADDEPQGPLSFPARTAHDLYADTTRLRERLQFERRYTLAQGLREMINVDTGRTPGSLPT